MTNQFLYLRQRQDTLTGATMTTQPIAQRPDQITDWPAGSRHYRITLQRNGEEMTVTFSAGAAHTEAPTVADVLESLFLDFSYFEYDFSEFCAETGQEPYAEDDEGELIDNPKARAGFDAIQAQSADLLRLFTSEEISEFSETINEVHTWEIDAAANGEAQ